MTDKDYHRAMQFTTVGGGLTPVSQNAVELLEQSGRGEVISFLEVTDRDLKFHRCYFALINYIYDQLPKRFHQKLDRKYFYQYLKHLKGSFDIVAQFGDIVLVEYDSISFGRMSDHTFREYVRTQLPWIYVNVIGKYYKVGGWRYNRKIDNIEEEFKKFLAKL